MDIADTDKHTCPHTHLHFRHIYSYILLSFSSTSCTHVALRHTQTSVHVYIREQMNEYKWFMRFSTLLFLTEYTRLIVDVTDFLIHSCRSACFTMTMIIFNLAIVCLNGGSNMLRQLSTQTQSHTSNSTGFYLVETVNIYVYHIMALCEWCMNKSYATTLSHGPVNEMRIMSLINLFWKWLAEWAIGPWQGW